MPNTSQKAPHVVIRLMAHTHAHTAFTLLQLLRPGSVEVRLPPLDGKNEGSIPVVLGFFLRSV